MNQPTIKRAIGKKQKSKKSKIKQNDRDKQIRRYFDKILKNGKTEIFSVWTNLETGKINRLNRKDVELFKKMKSKKF